MWGRLSALEVHVQGKGDRPLSAQSGGVLVFQTGSPRSQPQDSNKTQKHGDNASVISLLGGRLVNPRGSVASQSSLVSKLQASEGFDLKDKV